MAAISEIDGASSRVKHVPQLSVGKMGKTGGSAGEWRGKIWMFAILWSHTARVKDRKGVCMARKGPHGVGRGVGRSPSPLQGLGRDSAAAWGASLPAVPVSPKSASGSNSLSRDSGKTTPHSVADVACHLSHLLSMPSPALALYGHKPLEPPGDRSSPTPALREHLASTPT